MATLQAAPPVTPIEQRGYAHPEVLVSADWVAAHLTDPKVRLVESNEDILLSLANVEHGRKDELISKVAQRTAYNTSLYELHQRSVLAQPKDGRRETNQRALNRVVLGGLCDPWKLGRDRHERRPGYRDPPNQ